MHLSYVTKISASALVIAAAFAVAFAVLVSSTSTAQAATVTLGTGASTVDAQPGDTVVIPNPTGGTDIVDFSITGGTATGSFDTGDGQSVSCSDSKTGRGCDTNETEDEISVKLNIDADSADGYIIVKRDSILPVAGTDDTVVITVTTQPKPASLTAKAVETTINASDGNTQISATVKDDQPSKDGMNDERLTFVTTLGTMNCPASGSDNTAISLAQNVQWCQVWTSNSALTNGTAADGNAIITLNGTGRAGTAVVTITHGTLDPATVEVTMFGAADNLAAEAEQGSVEQGGEVFVVLTVTDEAGNPVSGAQPQPAATKAIVGPGDDPMAVTTSRAADGGYNVNKDVDGDGTVDKGDIPACGPVTAEDAVEGVGTFESTGTNQSGQCVVRVNAAADVAGTTDDEAATRGIHTLNFELDDLKASATVEVAGVATSIGFDPADGSEVDPLSETDITITVRDDEQVLVGATGITVRLLEGGGLIEGKATVDGGTDTVNGSTTVTFTAPSRAGVSTLIVVSGKARDTISLNVVVDEPEPPAPPAPEASIGGNVPLVVFFNTDTVEEAVGLVGCDGATTITLALTGGALVTYDSSAPSFVNTAFDGGVEFPLNGVPAFVTCG